MICIQILHVAYSLYFYSKFPQLFVSGITLEENSAAKLVYPGFYHHLVEAVPDQFTCRSLAAQLHSITLISQEKLAQLTSGGVTGSNLLSVLGVAEEPHLILVMEKMAGVKQLQRLPELMSARPSEVEQGACYVHFIIMSPELFVRSIEL